MLTYERGAGIGSNRGSHVKDNERHPNITMTYYILYIYNMKIIRITGKTTEQNAVSAAAEGSKNNKV